MARPPQPIITRERAIRVALRIIDRTGLERFSLERLASELKVKPPSLYHHFKGRDDLLAQVAAYLTHGTEVPADVPPEQWKDWLTELAVNLARAVSKHPNAAPLVVQYLPRQYFLDSYERAARLMSDAGVPPQLHVLILTGLERLAFGSAVFAAEWSRAEPTEGVFSAAGQRWAYPALHQAIESTAWCTHEELFRHTVLLFLEAAAADAGHQTAGLAPAAPGA